MSIEDFNVLVATEEHTPFAQAICDEMAESAKARGTGIAKRTPEYVANKMRAGKAVIAFHKDGTWPVSVTSSPGDMATMSPIRV